MDGSFDGGLEGQVSSRVFSPRPGGGCARTRLAPSPTGALHLGNALSFLINWALARREGWEVLLRIEDLDGPRIRPESVEQTIELLRWLGLDWDGPMVRQSEDLTPYWDALDGLIGRGLAYPCACTRKDIAEALSAPHGDGGELRYPGTCRPTGLESEVGRDASGGSAADAGSRGGAMHWRASRQWHEAGSAELLSGQSGAYAWRLRVPAGEIGFDDAIHGRQCVDVQREVGDFVIATKQGLPAYQLAVVVDDARQGVSHVVRGDDLLGSTGRQLWLYRLLGLANEPAYVHLPLVVGEDGRRLAKRHGDTRLWRYYNAGLRSRRVVGLLAAWAGLARRDRPTEMTAEDFAADFELAKLPEGPIVYTAADEAWLSG